MSETQLSQLSVFICGGSWEQLVRKLKLSPRENQIVQGVLEDQKDSAIARRLKISPHTVHTHMERLHGKLSVRDRSELILKIFTTFLSMTAEPGSGMPPICGNRAAGRCPLVR